MVLQLLLSKILSPTDGSIKTVDVKLGVGE